MKRLLLIVVVAALALTLVPLAVAGASGAGGGKRGHAKFNLVGRVTVAVPVVDPAAEPPAVSTITIAVKAGSHIKDIKGTEREFEVAAEVLVWQLTEDGKVESSIDKLAAGDKVMFKGMVTRPNKDAPGIYTITSIKYLDRTPDEAPTAEPSTPPAAR